MGSLELQPEEQVKSRIFSAKFFKKLYALLAISFSCTWLVTNGGTDLLQKFLIVAFLGFALISKELRRDPVVLGSLLVITFLTVQFFWQLHTVPEPLFAHRFPTKYVNFLCFFLLIAYGTVLWERLSPFLIIIGAAAGLLLFLLLYSSWEEWRLAWHGARAEFGFRNAQHAGIFFGTGLLGICFFSRRLLARLTGGLGQMLWGLAIFAFAAFMLYGVVVTQVRAVWIALILAFLTGAMAYFFTAGVSRLWVRIKSAKHLALSVLIVASVVALGSVLNIGERVQNRIKKENITIQTVEEAASLDGKSLTSSSIRIALWAASLQWIEERPLLGWGSRSAARLIHADTRFNQEFKHRFGHLHNSALEILVALGAIGLFSIGALYALLAMRISKARQAGAMPQDVFVFAWAFLIFWAVVNCFESYINYATGFYLNSIVIGFLYAFCLRRNAT